MITVRQRKNKYCHFGKVLVSKKGMIRNYIEKDNFEETGFHYALSPIAGKHKPVILYCLMEFEVVRFNQLKRYLKTVSDKTLSLNLKELEADGLIARRAYPEIPPRVEYALTEKGRSLMDILDALCVWGEEHRPAAGDQPSRGARRC